MPIGRGRIAPAARSFAAAAVLMLLASGLGAGVSAAGLPTRATLPGWPGGVDLYRPGTFTTQRTWLWCTAASVQIIRNISLGTDDHTRAGQQTYFDYMRSQNEYPIPLSDGVDPRGWAAGLRRFVDPSYDVVAHASFDAALRAAVTSLRLTNLPVGLLVAQGTHAWVLTGFTATADPAVTSVFRVTSVRVVGPLYGLQSRNGYDMQPDTPLSPSALARFLTPFGDPVLPMRWDGSFVTENPGLRSVRGSGQLLLGRPGMDPSRTPAALLGRTPVAAPGAAY